MNVTFQNAVEKWFETGLVAVKTGVDEGVDFRATRRLEALDLTKQNFFLVMRRDTGVARCIR